jgi:hypothetical protein
MPDPQVLTRTALAGALPSARRISKDCADFLVNVASQLRDAEHEMEKLREAERTGFVTGQTEAAKKAELNLKTAENLLKHAEDLLTQRNPTHANP